MARRRRPPSQAWRTFLQNHTSALVALDFFTMPTLTGRVLFVLVVLAYERRRILHVNVTAHPTSAWTRQQLRETFPWEVTPRYLLHARDAIFDDAFRRSVTALGLTGVRTAPRSPWQNPYVERVIGSMRRECLNHVIVLHERHLRRVLSAYVDYYHHARRTWRSRRMRRSRAPWRRSRRDASSPCPPLAGCIIATNAARPEGRQARERVGARASAVRPAAPEHAIPPFAATATSGLDTRLNYRHTRRSASPVATDRAPTMVTRFWRRTPAGTAEGGWPRRVRPTTRKRSTNCGARMPNCSSRLPPAGVRKTSHGPVPPQSA